MVVHKGVKQKPFSLQSLIVLVVLWLALITSSFGVVYVTYDTRVKFNLLETLRREQNQLQIVWGQYLLEESTWAGYGRVERVAEEKLLMQIPDSEKIIMVTP
ncbi:MAG: cell division protein FtsL [Cellvibrionaceae bacterium]